jgi:micrococcal nuclease
MLVAILLIHGCTNEFTGIVISVIDGDTFVVMDGAVQQRIRLFGIDCPEYTQVFGKEARQFTAAQLPLQKSVRIQPVDRDPYGRIVAKVYLPDGTYLNGEILSAGYGWWFRKYAPRDGVLEKLEQDAKTGKRGLWAYPNHPVEPWNFREHQRDTGNLKQTR